MAVFGGVVDAERVELPGLRPVVDADERLARGDAGDGDADGGTRRGAGEAQQLRAVGGEPDEWRGGGRLQGEPR